MRRTGCEGLHLSTSIDTNPTGDALLAVDHLSLQFGGVATLQDVSFRVLPDTVLGVIGPNGAGKTTLFNCIMRQHRAASGFIRVAGDDGGGAPAGRPHDLARLGIARTHQHASLVPGLSILENVLLGRHGRGGHSVLAAGLRLPRAHRWERAARSDALGALGRLGLTALADQPAAAMPLAVQKRIELARALALRPRLLMMDEPTAGLAPSEVSAFVDEIRALRAELGFSMLVIEHDMGVIADLCDGVIVLDFGRVIAEGRPDEVIRHPDVIQAYLGAGF